jgi:hypothetical protein
MWAELGVEDPRSESWWRLDLLVQRLLRENEQLCRFGLVDYVLRASIERDRVGAALYH